MDALNRTILEVYALAHEGSPEEFSDHLYALLRPLIAFDSAALLGLAFGPGHGYMPTSLSLFNQPVEAYRERQHWERGQSDPILLAASRNRNRSVHGEIRRFPGVTQAMLDHAAKVEHVHVLTYCAAGTDQSSELVALWRAGGECFNPHDAKLADVLLAHVVQARALHQRHLGIALRSGLEDDQILVASLDGRILLGGDAAVSALRREWPGWMPPFLPSDLMSSLVVQARNQYHGRALAVAVKARQRCLALIVRETGAANGLTLRERECLTLSRNGKTSAEIGQALSISERTANFHMANVRQKLGVRSRRDAVRKALSLGLID